ncbi:hypothetical protein LCGC14_1996160 [marine sediment metagenome]|uniref:Uncharacterized protein n=1 Tax=marine sediment metagenome TaxID=412755 RepID=A0A0F9FSN0_9ZZZZ
MTKEERKWIKEDGSFAIRMLAQAQHHRHEKDLKLKVDNKFNREWLRVNAFHEMIFAILADLINGDSGKSVVDRNKLSVRL